MHFQCLDVALQLVRCLRKPIERIQSHDRSLADQLRRAATSIPLNLSEGRRRAGKGPRRNNLAKIVAQAPGWKGARRANTCRIQPTSDAASPDGSAARWPSYFEAGPKDRRHLWRVAAGSADETRSCLLVATAWGYADADAEDVADALALVDRILAMTWRLTR